MIISFFIKYFRTILDALIIAAIIVAFFFFDPMGLFGGRLKIRDTPVAVERVRQIGQLITAEYYGEAIASLILNGTDTIEQEEFEPEGQAVFDQMIVSLDSLKKLEKSKIVNVKRRNIEKTMDEVFPGLARDRLYIPMLNYLKDTIRARSGKKYDRKDVLWNLYDDGRIREGVLTIDNGFQLEGLYSFVSKTEEERLEKVKNNIAYIGRGWVKAGIDFGEMRSSDISYSEQNRTIYIRGCKVEILDCDINPWFVPGKVKGYELIKLKGSFDNPFAEAVKVKTRCLENLRVQALKSGILEQADQNARESLKNLFSLLTGNEIERIVFTTNKFKLVLDEIGRDNQISDSEAAMVNELLTKSLIETDTVSYNDYRRQLADMRDFCASLKQYNYAGTELNAYSLDLSPFLTNDTINPFQLDTVAEILSRKNPCDSIEVKNKVFELMASYEMSQNQFIDSCLSLGVLSTGKTKVEHRLAWMARSYRDSIFSQAFSACSKTLKASDARYAIWFKNEAECDSARSRMHRHIRSLNPELPE